MRKVRWPTKGYEQVRNNVYFSQGDLSLIFDRQNTEWRWGSVLETLSRDLYPYSCHHLKRITMSMRSSTLLSPSVIGLQENRTERIVLRKPVRVRDPFPLTPFPLTRSHWSWVISGTWCESLTYSDFLLLFPLFYSDRTAFSYTMTLLFFHTKQNKKLMKIKHHP